MASNHRSDPPRRRSLRGVGVAAAVLILVGVIGIAWSLSAPRSTEGLVDLDGRTVVPESGVIPDSDDLAHMDVVESTGARFVVPSVDLDVPLGIMSSVDGLIEPPTFTAVYRIRDFGVAPADVDSGTVFVATHSMRFGRAPGNALVDVARGTSTLPSGARIDVDGVSFWVAGSEVIAKSELASRADVWGDQPGRLVVITCLQTPDQKPSTDNLVIVATHEP